jgi:two-component system response regulator (stage 0 sporulation protein A)
MLSEALQGSYSIRTCHEGTQALEMLRMFAPDILILDMMLPGLDGITLLQRASEQGLNPTVIAMTNYCSEYISSAAGRFHVSYMMRKPCEAEACAARIMDISQNLMVSAAPKTDPRTQISNILLQLGLSAKLKGYAYLREGILLFSRDATQLITKELYPAIGAKFGSSRDRVERAIRSAIQNAWKNRDHEKWNCLFARSGGYGGRCPTNSEFIARLTDHLMLDIQERNQE